MGARYQKLVTGATHKTLGTGDNFHGACVAAILEDDVLSAQITDNHRWSKGEMPYACSGSGHEGSTSRISGFPDSLKTESDPSIVEIMSKPDPNTEHEQPLNGLPNRHDGF